MPVYAQNEQGPDYKKILLGWWIDFTVLSMQYEQSLMGQFDIDLAVQYSNYLAMLWNTMVVFVEGSGNEANEIAFEKEFMSYESYAKFPISIIIAKKEIRKGMEKAIRQAMQKNKVATLNG